MQKIMRDILIGVMKRTINLHSIITLHLLYFIDSTEEISDRAQ